MAAKEFRNDPRRSNMEKLNKKAELYILQTTKKLEVIVPDTRNESEVIVAEMKPAPKLNNTQEKRPSRMV